MNILIGYALKFVGTNYLWGGNNAVQGMDCSGLMNEVLASVGMDPPGRDTAQSFYNHFIKVGTVLKAPVPGALIFFGKSSSEINHIAMAIDEMRMVEAGGGGHLVTSREEAAKRNATVRIRPYTNRRDLVAIILPNYPAWMEKCDE